MICPSPWGVLFAPALLEGCPASFAPSAAWLVPLLGAAGSALPGSALLLAPSCKRALAQSLCGYSMS